MSNLRNDLEWSPPIETGLSDDSVYLSEKIEHHAKSPSAAHAPGVYVLELSIPKYAGYETYTRLWLADESKQTTPQYLELIAASQRLLYVGSASGEGGVYGRLQTHLEANKPGGVNKSTTIASVFPIHSIVDITFYDTGQAARENEQSHADELAQQHPEAYIHCR